MKSIAYTYGLLYLFAPNGDKTRFIHVDGAGSWIENPLFANSNLQNSDEAIAADDMGLGGLVDNQLMNISSKGSEAPIVFINTPTSESAYILSGRYEVKGNTVTVRINIRQNKEVKQRFEVTGTKDNLKTLAEKIAQTAAGLVK